MDIINRENPNKVSYFNLHDFMDKIKIDSNVLAHMEDTNIEFDKYMKKISSYNFDDVVHLWLIQTAEELVSSSKIERHYIDKKEILKKNLFFDTLSINHKRIHELHNFVLPEQPVTDYRTTPVKVAYVDQNNVEHIYWHGAEAEDIYDFMDDFLEIYKSTDLSVINSNPFLKSALMMLLFVRIHPYTDGNGRTSRLLYNIKFTRIMNRLYGTNLKICPLNISASILMNQFRYVEIIDNIYFDIEHDNNEWINKWFDYILNMSDEQLNYMNNKISELDFTYNFYNTKDPKLDKMLNQILYDIQELNNDESVKVKEKKIDNKG